MKPRLLDLFCKAGGAARGYQRTGFYVVGVDIEPQPRYAGDEFIHRGALGYLEELLYGKSLGHAFPFAAIHASPPCQHFANVTQWRGDQSGHLDLIVPARALLEQTGMPWVIENVRTSALRADFMLCGTTLGLPIRRHRFFETNWSGLVMAHPCQHQDTDLAFEHKRERAYADAMGCGWMTAREAREAIPPAYTELIGHQLMQHVRARAA